jgi:hypothetical protein
VKWDALTILLLAVAAIGLGVAIAYDVSAPGASAGGAAFAALAGVAILLRGTLETAPARPRARAAEPPPPAARRITRLDQDAFARRELYDSLASLSHRVLGADRWAYSTEEADRVCAAPPSEFRVWASARLDELEGEE